MIPAKAFYLIRHGETEANAAHLAAGGGLDSPLTERGKAQAMAVAAVIHTLDLPPSKIVHSPMSRARDTASYINEKLKLPMHEYSDLREHMLGEWEGQPWENVLPHLSANTRPKGGENKDDFGVRVRRSFNDVLSAHEDPVLIVAHGGIFHSLLHIHEHPYDGTFMNCHLHYFEPYPGYTRFPWRVWHFQIEGNKLVRDTAPFCSTLADLDLAVQS